MKLTSLYSRSQHLIYCDMYVSRVSLSLSISESVIRSRMRLGLGLGFKGEGDAWDAWGGSDQFRETFACIPEQPLVPITFYGFNMPSQTVNVIKLDYSPIGRRLIFIYLLMTLWKFKFQFNKIKIFCPKQKSYLIYKE